MILVDTSVWIDHIRKAEPLLVQLLDNTMVLAHQLVIGELAVSQFKHQDEILEQMLEMPQATMAETFEVLTFIKETPWPALASDLSTPTCWPPSG